MTFGIAFFGEPEDGVMTAGAWAARIVIVAVATSAAWGSFWLFTFVRRARLVAIPVLGLFALLSAASIVQALARQTTVPLELWLNVGMFVACATSIAVLIRASTWIAIEGGRVADGAAG